MDIDYESFSIKGDLHQYNEDRSLMLGEKAELVKNAKKGQIFAVFDGMGSAPKGGDAAQFMCNSLIEFIENKDLEADQKTLVDVLMKSNLKINAWGCIKGTEKEIGACAGTIAWIKNEDLYIFHVGDTICLLLKADDENDADYERLTTDQAIGDDLLAFWGMGQGLKIEQWITKISEGDILVLISDGVIKAIDLKTIAAMVREWLFKSLKFAAKSLCEMAKNRGSTDDITAVIVEIIEFD